MLRTSYRLRWLFLIGNLVFFVTIEVTALLTEAALATNLTPLQQRGQQIYLQGTSPSGARITAFLGRAGVEVPASVLPCVNCHGHDGRGKPEGGVSPSNITWEALTKPYGVTHPSGRKHPPYTEKQLKRAITMGLDAAGQRLHVAMPRYGLTQQDLANLIAYLKQIGQSLDPGLTETSIRLGTILPSLRVLGDRRQAVKQSLTAYFAEVNRQGGVYNRQIELHFVDSPDAPEVRASAIRAFLEDKRVFALVESFMAGAEKELADLVSEKGIPVVGAMTLYPQVDFPLNRFVFYLYSGLAAQGRALANFAAQKYREKSPRAAILYPEPELTHEAAEHIRRECQRLEWEAVQMIRLPYKVSNVRSVVRQLAEKGTEILFFLGTGASMRSFLKEAQTRHWTPTVLMPGVLGGSELFDAPVGLDGRVFLSFPTLPNDHSPNGIQEYRRIAKKHGLPREYVTAQLSTLSSAKILVEGLKRAGRDVTREKLISTLESLYEFPTGLTPKITYGPNRRIGALGSYIVAVDLKERRFVPVSSWLELN